jgi:hypothetical protein
VERIQKYLDLGRIFLQLEDLFLFQRGGDSTQFSTSSEELVAKVLRYFSIINIFV